ncbi:hypothetical protein PAECIP111893_03074 [Paenibacillus plantiphilus]|uniref:Excalibur calcium-binding domain-containing protein n=2 Tax=Paenibacillus plantiphilus TaxID=2905650 RepID=A0ABM9CD04_9BACL|nr:hypothetical protein PAECIP111893_03074 [Paenibacillus plantiphilus]
MWMFIGLISLLVAIIFVIIAAISAIIKNNKAKKNFIISGIAFVVFFVAVAASSDPASQEVTKKEEPHVKENVIPKKETEINESVAVDSQSAIVNTTPKKEPTEAEWQASYREILLKEASRYLELTHKKTITAASKAASVKVLKKYTEKLTGEDEEKFEKLTSLIQKDNFDKAKQLYLSLGGKKSIFAAPNKKAANTKESTTKKETVKNNVTYKNCTQVKAAGAAPLHKGDPGYSRKLDKDGDGVACE